jgi:hypothetical protein
MCRILTRGSFLGVLVCVLTMDANAQIPSSGRGDGLVSPGQSKQVKIVQDEIKRLEQSITAVFTVATNASSPAKAMQEVEGMIAGVEKAITQCSDGSQMLKAVDEAIKAGQDTMNDFKKKSIDATFSDSTRAGFEARVKRFEPTLQSCYMYRTKVTKYRDDLDACKRLLSEQKLLIAADLQIGDLEAVAATLKQCVEAMEGVVGAVKKLGNELPPPPK